MSPTTLNTPTRDIIQSETPADILRAAANDPALKNILVQGLQALAQAVADKSLFASKTFWAALITPAVLYGATRLGLGWDEATCAEVSTGMTTVAMIVMRVVTKTPVTVLPTSKGIIP